MSYNFIKPETFIKTLPGIQNLDSQFVDDLDNHFFNYVEMHLPFYKEMKRREADVFECQNCTTLGKDWAECYEKNGHHYRFDEKTCFGKCLSLDGGAGYEDLQWRSLFWNKYPQYHGSISENWKTKDTHFFHWYLHRYYKKEPKYNVVQDLMKEYFRYLTQDSEIIFDAGWHTFIYYNLRVRRMIDSNPSQWY